jgi:rare lipoprotein A
LSSSTGRGPLVALALLLAGCASPVEEQWPAASPPPAAWGAPPVEAAQPLAPPYQSGRASFYADRLAGHRTALGELYDPSAFTAAHRSLPLGAVVDVARPDGRHVRVRINDRGPHARGRIIDLSRRAAREIGMEREGVTEVVLRVLWVPSPGLSRM